MTDQLGCAVPQCAANSELHIFHGYWGKPGHYPHQRVNYNWQKHWWIVWNGPIVAPIDRWRGGRGINHSMICVTGPAPTDPAGGNNIYGNIRQNIKYLSHIDLFDKNSSCFAKLRQSAEMGVIHFFVWNISLFRIIIAMCFVKWNTELVFLEAKPS